MALTVAACASVITFVLLVLLAAVFGEIWVRRPELTTALLLGVVVVLERIRWLRRWS